MRKLTLAAALLAATTTWSFAGSISYSFQFDGGSPITTNTSDSALAPLDLALLGATIHISATAFPSASLPSIFDSSITLQFPSGALAAHTVNIWVTARDFVVSPPVLGAMFPSITSTSSVSPGWSVLRQTFISLTNDLFVGSSAGGSTNILAGDPFSIIHQYTFTTTAGAGSAFAAINTDTNIIPITAGVPGPTVGAGLPGLLAAFGGYLAWRKCRRRAAWPHGWPERSTLG